MSGLWRRLAPLSLAAPLLLAAQTAVMVQVKLQHREVRSVLGRVLEEVGPEGQVTADRASNVLIVRDTPGRIEAVRRLLARLDVPARRFALQAELGLYDPPKRTGLLRETADTGDATSWLGSAAPKASAALVLDLWEGKRAEGELLAGYRLRAAAEGFDPTRRRLALSELSLGRGTGPDARTLLRGNAVLPEGEPTVLVASPPGEPICRLRLTPTLLPSPEEKELP